LDKPLYDTDSHQTLADTIPTSHVADPSDLVANEEFSQNLNRLIFEHLSPMEAETLRLYLGGGASYADIAEEMDRTTKSVDNALQRVKKKLGQTLGEEYANLILG
jgi:RNA polymerase sporulation-specific sigma factor